MLETFGVHLEVVKRLLDAIRKKIFDNISDCFAIVQVRRRRRSGGGGGSSSNSSSSSGGGCRGGWCKRGGSKNKSKK